MILGGIQKNSLIDFPSNISCVIFTAGCNFDCPYCHNPELVTPPFTTIKIEEIFSFLKKRKNLIDGVVITGGEPTLQKDLFDFCKKIKSMGFLIKLDTNGSHPEIIQALAKNDLIDYVAMDIKTQPEKYFPDITKNISPKTLLKSIEIIKNACLPHEFRTTCIKPFVTAEIIEQIAQIVNGADLFALQKAVISDAVLHPAFFQNRDWQVDMKEMQTFQKTILPFVKKTIIR